MNTYGIKYLNGQFEKEKGNSFAEAFLKNSKSKTKKGEIDFSILDFFFLIPVPMNPEETNKKYQLYLMKNKQSNWEEFEKPTNQLSSLELLLNRKVKLEGVFSALILDLETEKPIQWLWSK